MVESSRNLILRGAVIGLAITLALGAWVLAEDEPSTGVPSGERRVSPAQLVEVAADLDHPVYWAGRMRGARLTLVEFDQGVQVRYERPGETAVESLTVGSYPLTDPEQVVEERAQQGAIVRAGADGRRVVSDPRRPSSVFFADSSGEVEVEVYDPSPARALGLATGDQVRPVE